MLVLTSVKLSVLALACLPVVVLPLGAARPARARLSRGWCRIAWRKCPPTSTRRCTRSAPCRPTRTRRTRTRAFAAWPTRCSPTSASASAALALLIAAVIVLAFGAVGLLLWVGAHDVLAGRLSVGSLTAFIFYAVIVANATFVLAEAYGELQRAAGASERLTELLATLSAIRASGTPAALPERCRGPRAARWTSRSATRRGRKVPRSRASPRRGAGRGVALVGPSGAGKTTVFQLLLRFYDPQQGAVLLDGVDARDAEPKAWRRHFALVPQEPVIFAASVADNVRYGRPEATEEAGARGLPARLLPRVRRSACRRDSPRRWASAA